MIEEYARDKAESETESTTIDKAEGIEIARDEPEAKARAKYYMRKQVWRAKYLGLKNSKNS